MNRFTHLLETLATNVLLATSKAATILRTSRDEAKHVIDRSEMYFMDFESAELTTARTWPIKESLRVLCGHQSEAWAGTFWRRWYSGAMHSRLKPIVKAAKLIVPHILNVMTYFTHRITNAVAEDIDSRIATLQKTGLRFSQSGACWSHCVLYILVARPHIRPLRPIHKCRMTRLLILAKILT